MIVGLVLDQPTGAVAVVLLPVRVDPSESSCVLHFTVAVLVSDDAFGAAEYVQL